MARVYFDSNIFRMLKQGKQFNPELFNAVDDLKNKLLFIFSDAHIEDLKESDPSRRMEDLQLMGKYVKDNYFSYDHIKKQFHCYLATPQEAFDSKDFAAAKLAIANPFNFDALFEGMEESPELKLAKELMDGLLDMPIAPFPLPDNLDHMGKGGKELMTKLLPNYHSEMSIRQLINDSSPYSIKLLHDEKEVTQFRKYVSEMLNRETYSFEKWDLEFNEKFREAGVGKSYLEMVDSLLLDHQKEDFYLRFSYAYTMLEMFNVTEERTGRKRKKFDLENLHTDGMHAYYASFCDYFVTNDRGMQVKSNILYHFFGFPTRVLSPEDFIAMRTQFLGQEETWESFAASFTHDLKHSFLMRQTTEIESGRLIKHYKTGHHYFNLFNRLQIIIDNGFHTYALYCERNSHGNFYLNREIEFAVNKLVSIFGIDDDAKGTYDFLENEKNEANDEIRRWTRRELQFALINSSLKRGSFIALTVEMVERKQ